MSEDVRPFEEYKEMIQNMSKEEMIKGLYDLSARVTKQENIIKEVRERLEPIVELDNDIMLKGSMLKPVLDLVKE